MSSPVLPRSQLLARTCNSGTRFSDPTLSWPPRGITLEIDFEAPESAPPPHNAVVITVVYSMYNGIPLYEKHVVVTSPGGKVKVSESVNAMILGRQCHTRALAHSDQCIIHMLLAVLMPG
jgi:hypothetical protein